MSLVFTQVLRIFYKNDTYTLYISIPRDTLDKRGDMNRLKTSDSWHILCGLLGEAYVHYGLIRMKIIHQTMPLIWSDVYTSDHIRHVGKSIFFLSSHVYNIIGFLICKTSIEKEQFRRSKRKDLQARSLYKMMI